MLDRIRKEEWVSVDHLNELLKKMNMKQVPVKKKRSMAWLAVLIGVLSVAAIGYAVYKYFFAIEDDFEDFEEYEDDFEEADYDEEEEEGLAGAEQADEQEESLDDVLDEEEEKE